MRYRSLVFALLAALCSAAVTSASAQEPGARRSHKTLGPADIIMPHITDSKNIELPCWKGFERVGAARSTLPTWNVTDRRPHDRLWSDEARRLASASAAHLRRDSCVVSRGARTRAEHSRRSVVRRASPPDSRRVILYLRNEVFMPVLGGHGGERYIPFVLSLFFFILFCNLFGLVPYGSTPTGNISVTVTLAIITFIVVEIAGMRALGRGYLGTIIYWPHDMPIYLRSCR